MINQQIYNILIAKSVSSLFHSNTVETSLSFFKAGGLLSRGSCDDIGYPQTPQRTDQTDKDLGIYYDLFFDSVDIHKRANNTNYYGPVLFEYDIRVLNSISEGYIRITKSNPITWSANDHEDDRYYLDADNLALNFIKGDFGQHITIKDYHLPLSFSYLKRIIITNPHNDFNNYYNNALDALYQAISDNDLDVSLEERICNEKCKCLAFYSNNYNVQRHYRLGDNQ